MVNNGDKNQWVNNLLKLLQVFVAATLPIMGYLFSEVQDLKTRHILDLASLDRRVVAIESNRWTSADAAKQQKEIADLWKELAQIPKETPSWFIDRVTKLEERVEKLNEKLDLLNDKIIRLLDKTEIKKEN